MAFNFFHKDTGFLWGSIGMQQRCKQDCYLRREHFQATAPAVLWEIVLFSCSMDLHLFSSVHQSCGWETAWISFMGRTLTDATTLPKVLGKRTSLYPWSGFSCAHRHGIWYCCGMRIIWKCQSEKGIVSLKAEPGHRGRRHSSNPLPDSCKIASIKLQKMGRSATLHSVALMACPMITCDICPAFSCKNNI